MNRRVGFFLLAALVCFALVPALDTKFHWVPTTLGIVYLVLAALAALDVWGRRRL